MSSKFTKRLLICFLLIAPSARSFAQQNVSPTVAAEVPEKVMAANLLQSLPVVLPVGAIPVKCSNRLVVLDVTVDEQGKVIGAKKISGFAELIDPSIASVKQWTYKPFMQNGVATPAHTRVSIFLLGDGESFPMYKPDGKGGAKGGNMIPMPPDCALGPRIKSAP
jgi:hypothetical protein